MKYYASCSFGKDSLATILLAKEHNEPLDGIVFSEVMFDRERGISGEEPEHITWIKTVAIPKLKELGYETYIVRSQEDYLSQFNHIKTKSKYPERNGKKQGFPMAGKCIINKQCKLKPIRQFFHQFKKEEVIQYVGIALDEPERLERLHKKPNRISLLEKYQYTEEMAYNLCLKYDLLSPIYQSKNRGGCWFCPNKSYQCLATIKKEHPELWKELETLSKDKGIVGGFKYQKTFQEVNDKIDIINKNKA